MCENACIVCSTKAFCLVEQTCTVKLLQKKLCPFLISAVIDVTASIEKLMSQAEEAIRKRRTVTFSPDKVCHANEGMH